MRLSIMLANIGIGAMLIAHDMWFVATVVVVGSAASLLVD